MEKLDDKQKKEETERIKAAISKNIEDGVKHEFRDLKNVGLKTLGKKIKGLSDNEKDRALSSEAMAAQEKSENADKNRQKDNADPANSRLGAGRQKIQEKAQGIKGRAINSVNSRLKAGQQKTQEKAKMIKDRAIKKVKNQEQVKRMSKIAQDKQNQIKTAREQAKKRKERMAKKLKAQKKAMLKKAQEIKKRAVTAKKSHAPAGAVKLLTVITLILAILVDLIDLIGTLGVELAAIPTIIAFIINFCSSLIITITWILIFSESKGKNKKMAKVTIRSVLMLFGLENVPLVELLPFNAIAVILNYLDFRKGNKEKS
ncbi:MAG: hypothetical protein U9P70_02015 [Patescibacteria group bacterium]|nr:hypothetical protein [Patescibacteria group bacterium]